MCVISLLTQLTLEFLRLSNCRNTLSEILEICALLTLNMICYFQFGMKLKIPTGLKNNVLTVYIANFFLNFVFYTFGFPKKFTLTTLTQFP